MNKIKLSISIPSNNKVKYLISAIESIVREVNNKKSIEINISDNSNFTENKKKLIKNNNLFNNINYFSSNYSSLDLNVNNSINISQGKYVWIFGDDDIIHKGSLNKILEYLDKNDPDVLIVNSSSFIDNEVIETRRCKILENKKYEKHNKYNDDFLEDMGNYLTYIGSIIIKKNVWQANLNKNYFGTFFNHLSVILLSKINGSNIHYLSTPVIKMRVNSQTWTNSYFKIWNINFPEVIWSFKNFSKKSKQKVTAQYSIFRLVALNAYGHFNFRLYIEFILQNKKIGIFFKIISFFISLLPKIITSKIYYYFIIFFRNKHTNKFSPKLAKKLLKL